MLDYDNATGMHSQKEEYTAHTSAPMASAKIDKLTLKLGTSFEASITSDIHTTRT
jgi:hypothetical protein